MRGVGAEGEDGGKAEWWGQGRGVGVTSAHERGEEYRHGSTIVGEQSGASGVIGEEGERPLGEARVVGADATCEDGCACESDCRAVGGAGELEQALELVQQQYLREGRACVSMESRAGGFAEQDVEGGQVVGMRRGA